MYEKTLNIGDIEVNKKESNASKQPIALDLVDINQTVISEKVENSDKDSKYSIGYQDDNIIRPLCVILPQMSRFIKYFDNGGKNKSFVIEDDSVLVKYNEIPNGIKKILNIKFHNKPVYDEKYIRTKVKTFTGVANTIFWSNKFPKKKNTLHLHCSNMY